MRFTFAFFGIFLLGATCYSGQLPALQYYVESGGMAAGEAEFYHARTAAMDDNWTEISATAPGAMQNARGIGYVQALPDGDGTIKSFTNGASIDYKIQIQTPGTYRLWLRWDGVNDSSDSLLAGILELGGTNAPAEADWYELYGHLDANFDTNPWDGVGGFEQNQATPDPLVAMIWNITNAGIYTLRMVTREDGAAIDTWVFQLNSLPAPSGDGPLIPNPDSMVMHHLSKAGIPVLKNDSGINASSVVEIVNAPLSGIASSLSDGRILYEHTTGSPADDTLMYRVINSNGQTSSPVLVTIDFSNNLRIPNSTVNMPLEAPPTSYQVVDAFPNLSFASPTSMESPAGDTNRLFIAQRNGQVYVIPNVSAATPQSLLFLDISSRVHNDNNELGMKGITFHPGYATNRIFYVTYCHVTGGNIRYVRLSRFLRDENNPNVADPNSEVMLINQRNDDWYHNIDDALFGPDGYMYVGIGDEGPQNDGNNNSQTITKDIWSAVLRIDPDRRPGNLEPRPHSGIPTNNGGLAHFSIPTNNPFVGATQFNGTNINPALVRTEFYAVGFRNPWQFSFDALTGEMWLGDVGNNDWEEINVVVPGGNYGWAYYEGTHNGPKAPPPGFTYQRPVWEYQHGNGEFQGYSVSGGFVYRGSKYSDLQGKYLCTDYVSGNIWTIERTSSATNVVRITGEGGIVQFGLNPANGDIIMLDLGDGKVRRLATESSELVFPQKLSETGFFADLSDLSPNPGVVAYEPNLAFWSDYAIKSRWFVITNLTDEITYSRDGVWSFPTGMMWVKHFDYDLDRGNTNTRTRLETRILVRTPGGTYGVSYQWNTNGTEATLVPDAGINFDLNITNQGVAQVQTWRIPSRAECLICHTPAGGHALSFNTRQLNAPGEMAGQSDNQISLLDVAGYLGNSADDPATLPRHIRPDETEYSLETRARSYLAVNCGYCHMGSESIVPGNWDGRAFVKLNDTGMIRGHASDNGGDTNNLLVVPADVPHSIIWNRMAATNGFSRMPPLATFELDPANIQMVSEWISTDLASWQNYDMWRLARFGNTNSLEGAPDFDADSDERTNYEEFLTRTNPNDEFEYWSGEIIYGEDTGLSVGHDLYNRSVVIEITTNLENGAWTRWNVSANNGLPISSGTVLRISAPATNETEYFRYKVEEL